MGDTAEENPLFAPPNGGRIDPSLPLLPPAQPSSTPSVAPTSMQPLAAVAVGVPASASYMSYAAAYLPALPLRWRMGSGQLPAGGVTPGTTPVVPPPAASQAVDATTVFSGYPGPTVKPSAVSHSRYAPATALPLTSSATVMVVPQAARADASIDATTLTARTAFETGADAPANAALGSNVDPLAQTLETPGSPFDHNSAPFLYTSPLPQHLPPEVMHCVNWLTEMRRAATYNFEATILQLAQENAVLKNAVDRECADATHARSLLVQAQRQIASLKSLCVQQQEDIRKLVETVERMHRELLWAAPQGDDRDGLLEGSEEGADQEGGVDEEEVVSTCTAAADAVSVPAAAPVPAAEDRSRLGEQQRVGEDSAAGAHKRGVTPDGLQRAPALTPEPLVTSVSPTSHASVHSSGGIATPHDEVKASAGVVPATGAAAMNTAPPSVARTASPSSDSVPSTHVPRTTSIRDRPIAAARSAFMSLPSTSSIVGSVVSKTPLLSAASNLTTSLLQRVPALPSWTGSGSSSSAHAATMSSAMPLGMVSETEGSSTNGLVPDRNKRSMSMDGVSDGGGNGPMRSRASSVSRKAQRRSGASKPGAVTSLKVATQRVLSQVEKLVSASATLAPPAVALVPPEAALLPLANGAPTLLPDGTPSVALPTEGGATLPVVADLAEQAAAVGGAALAEVATPAAITLAAQQPVGLLLAAPATPAMPVPPASTGAAGRSASALLPALPTALTPHEQAAALAPNVSWSELSDTLELLLAHVHELADKENFANTTVAEHPATLRMLTTLKVVYRPGITPRVLTEVDSLLQAELTAPMPGTSATQPVHTASGAMMSASQAPHGAVEEAAATRTTPVDVSAAEAASSAGNVAAANALASPAALSAPDMEPLRVVRGVSAADEVTVSDALSPSLVLYPSLEAGSGSGAHSPTGTLARHALEKVEADADATEELRVQLQRNDAETADVEAAFPRARSLQAFLESGPRVLGTGDAPLLTPMMDAMSGGGAEHVTNEAATVATTAAAAASRSAASRAAIGTQQGALVEDATLRRRRLLLFENIRHPHPGAFSLQKRIGRGLRILSLDGGGIRGMVSLEILKKIETDTHRQIHELFDLICGTSTGGLIAVAVCARKRLDEIAQEYQNIRATIESQSALMSEVRRFTVGTSYSHLLAEATLKRFFAGAHMSTLPVAPKCFVVCAAADSFPPQPYLFRSYELAHHAFTATEFLGTSNVYAHEAVRATTAAPTYYEPAVIGGQKMVDGAILQNNPSIVALCEAAMLWPGVPVDALVSIGTGTQSPRPMAPSGVIDWVKIVLDLAMSAYVTHKIASSLLTGRYFRFDADGCGDVDLSETRLDVLARMLEDGRKYIQREEPRFAALRHAFGYDLSTVHLPRAGNSA